MGSDRVSVDNCKNVAITDSIATNTLHIGDNIINYNFFHQYEKIESDIEIAKDLLGRLMVDELEKKDKILNDIKYLESEKQAFISEVYRLTRIFNTTSFKSNRLKIAEEYFKKGNLKEADAILKTEDMYKDKELALIEKQTADKKCKELSNEFLIKAKLSELQYGNFNRFKDTCKLYEDSLQLSSRFENISEYAFYLQKHNENNRAITYYNLILVEHFYNLDFSSKATILNNLANLHKSRNDYKKAEEMYEKALIIRRILAETQLETDIFEVTAVLNNLALLQSEKKNFKEAEKNYKEALNTRKKLAELNYGKYIPYVARIIHNYALLLSDEGKYEEAEIKYEEALNIRRELAKKNPEEYIPNLAATLNDFAIMQNDIKKYKEGEKNFKESLEYFKMLAKKNSEAYIPFLANVLNNIAILQSNNGENGEAEKNYKEALNLQKKLVEKNSETYMPFVACTLNNLADLQSDIGEYEEAMKNYEEALIIRRNLVEKNPEIYSSVLIETLMSDSSLNLDIFNDRSKAQQLCYEALGYINKYFSINECYRDECICILESCE